MTPGPVAALDPLLLSLHVEPLSTEEASPGACRAEARLLSSLSPTGGPSLFLVPPLPPPACWPPPAASLSGPCPCVWKASFTSIPSGLSQNPWHSSQWTSPVGVWCQPVFLGARGFSAWSSQQPQGWERLSTGTLGSSVPPTPGASVSQSLWLGHSSPVFKEGRKERGQGKE